MSLEKVQQALIFEYAAAFPLWVSQGRIAWENIKFAPPSALPWMAFFFMPVGETIGTLGGDAGYDKAEGLVQIDLNYPTGAGEGNTRTTINELRACFRPRKISYDGQEVTILSRSRAGGMQSSGFYKIPFNVRWRAAITRTD